MPRRYKVGLVGESNYQPAIRRCRAGDAVLIVHEIGNPYDDDALAAVDSAGRTIGYIGRDSWLRDAIHDEDRGCRAVIKSIDRSDGGALGVVLDVTLTDDDLGVRNFAPETSQSPEGRADGLAGMVGDLGRGFSKVGVIGTLAALIATCAILGGPDDRDQQSNTEALIEKAERAADLQGN